MKVHEINFPNSELIELLSDDGTEFNENMVVPSEVEFRYESSMDRFILSQDGSHWPVKGVDDRNQDLLNKLGENKLPNISWLVGRFFGNKNKSTVIVQINQFPISQSWGEELCQFGIDEKIIEQARTKFFKHLVKAEKVTEWLFQETIIEASIPNQKQRLLISIGPTVRGVSKTAFQIHGRSINVNVRQQDDGKLRVERIIFSRTNNENKNPLILVDGAFLFCDISVAGVFKDTRKNEVDRLVERADSYLKLWRDYNKIERNIIIQKARRFGYHSYENPIRLSNGAWRFKLFSSEKVQNALLELSRIQTQDMEASLVPPSELLDPGQFDLDSKSNASYQPGVKQFFIGKFISSDPIKFTIDIQSSGTYEDSVPPEKGVIHFAMTGDRIRLDRRNKAELLIRSMSGPMPQLVDILLGLNVASGRRKSEKAYSPAAVERFDGIPTQVQMDALDIALNTPNIALIQGPPGTGKTRVIAALGIRLAEINKERELPGKTLLTSYQHDAVTFAAAKTVVFGLPAIKIGTKNDQYEVEDGVDEWRKQRIESLETDLANLPDKPASQIYRQVKNLVIGYRKAPTLPEQTILLLDKIAQISANYLSPDIYDQFRELKDSLKRGFTSKDDDQKEERDRALSALKALRTQSETFLDDGASHTRKTLYWLRKLNCLSPEDDELMERAANWDQEESPSFLEELNDVKNRMIDNLDESTRLAGIPLENEDVSNLLNLWSDTLYNNLRDSKEGPDSVVSDYLDDLQNDPDGIRIGIREYTSVLAATCQQADSDPIAKIKDKEPFETVLIDEAARANPLDLFIPMSLAERRIILVGDHRQLPQVLEPEVERLLEQSVQDQTQNAFKKSLFERLFKQLKKSKEIDGITRTITLNVQYRMHPQLGDFISRVFYEPWNEGFSSGKREEEFIHNNPLLKNEDKANIKVAAWVDIPPNKGSESDGKSKKRTVEAEWISKNIKPFMDADPDFTFGIITFYQAQVREILIKLCEQEMADQLDNGSYQIKRIYENRLQVDTVDAYQGKEFDVVILSMVRSNNILVSTNKDLRRKYGFLMLPNRLCVAMSRQKTLLIVVGDLAMVDGKVAGDAVPGLVEFKKLCEGPYGKFL